MKFEHSRREALGAVAATLVVAAVATPAAADASADVAKAVEALRTAMFKGDGKALDALTLPALTYGHSNGNVQNKKEFVDSLAGQTAFQTLDWTNIKITVVGDNAVVRQTFDAINILPENKTSKAHIHVLTVWKKVDRAWKLLARQAAPLPA